jgi:hypothetical protein
MDIIHSYFSIISNLVFRLITYLFLLKTPLRNEINTFFRFYFLQGLSTRVTSIILKTKTLSTETKFNEMNSKSTDPDFGGYKKELFSSL